MSKDMCQVAGIEGHKTNHSLRATGASELFEAGVPEKIIKERTGLVLWKYFVYTSTPVLNSNRPFFAVLSAEKKILLNKLCTLNSAVIIRRTQLQSKYKIVDLIILTIIAHFVINSTLSCPTK